MLENPALLIQPWQCTSQGPVRRRAVIHPASGELLGFIAGPNGWSSWLTGQPLQVFETDDASLVFSVYRPWLLRRSWDVRDAEKRRVGRIYRSWVLDGDGKCWARCVLSARHGGGRFIAPDGAELASFEQRDGNAVVLTYQDSLDPFSRMTLLAAVVAQE